MTGREGNGRVLTPLSHKEIGPAKGGKAYACTADVKPRRQTTLPETKTPIPFFGILYRYYKVGCTRTLLETDKSFGNR